MPNRYIRINPEIPISWVQPIALPLHRILHAVAALLLLQGVAHQIWSETSYNPDISIDAEQFILPWDGPGAAVFNPAWITETKHVDGRFAFGGTTSGKNGKNIFQASGNSPWGIAVGFNRFEKESSVDGSNAIYEEAINTTMAAWGGRNFMGSGIDGGGGIAYVRHDFNAFGAIQSQAYAWDFGLHASVPATWNLGRLHSGLTLRNFAAEGVELPQDNPSLIGNEYNALLINVDAFFLLKSAFDCFDAYLEINMHRDQDASEGPRRKEPSMIKSMGVEYRPIPYAGLKIERTWLKRWTAGLVGHGNIPIGDGIEIGAEANVAHDKFFGPQDEGRGYLVSLAVNAGM